MKKEKNPARYEFRIFSNHCKKASQILAGLHPVSKDIKSSELYILLNNNFSINIKIRDNRLEIKTLVEIKEDLQKWDPVLIEEFPYLQKPYKNISPFYLTKKKEYTKQEFLKLIKKSSGIKTVSVNKTRTKYLFKGMICESSIININGKSWVSICIESENIYDLKNLINYLDLMDIKNTSYVQFLNTAEI